MKTAGEEERMGQGEVFAPFHFMQSYKVPDTA